MGRQPGRPPTPQAVAEAMAKGVKKGVTSEQRILTPGTSSIAETYPRKDKDFSPSKSRFSLLDRIKRVFRF